MIRKTPKSAAGLALILVVSANSSLPVFAQQIPAQLPVQAPFPPSNQAPAYSPPAISQPGTLEGEAYTLGAGDIVRVDIFDIAPELALEQRYTILTDGTVNLPWVGSVPVAGLSLRQAADVLSQRFSRFIRNPVVTVSLLAPRPLKVGVIGEVNRPGSYIISVISNEVTQTSLNQRTASEGGNQWPRVSQAIQTAGGITGLANLREVKIRRPKVSGGEELIAIDLWRFLKEGDLNQDILLRDGDTIIISKATIQDSEEATQIATSNFSPATISVSVVGEVGNPGTLQVKPTTTLNQAIMAAGGFRGGRASRKNVDLIRLNPNGTVTRRRMSIDLDQNMNEDRNPRLFNNDIVVVNRTFIAGVNDFLINAIGVPLTIFSGISGFRGLVRPNN
ncbi:periplasmic protein involved in polysaccharide export [Leptolyngbyaceae cyanobacterium JSC-12]|nr:periplasmic protein involved in polysaccharide export [Leptolyngbyaceae cyanobacterium JSC-12]